jgi:hypothetical protein
MKHVRYFLAAAALLAAAACSQAGGITSPESADPRTDGYIGSGGFVGEPQPDGITSTGVGATLPGAPADSAQTPGGGGRAGYIGSGG